MLVYPVLNEKITTMTDRLPFYFVTVPIVFICSMLASAVMNIAAKYIRIFFKNKQEQSEKVASLQDYTLRRLGSCYKTQLYEAGLLESNRANSTRKILKPILDIAFEHWLYDHDLGIMVKTLTGVR